MGDVGAVVPDVFTEDEYNTVKGAFGESWVATLACAAGVGYAPPNVDRFAFDHLLTDVSGEVIRCQIKLTEHPDARDDHYAFKLDVSAYNRLRKGRTDGFLVLCVATHGYPDWTAPQPTSCVVRVHAYWARLTGLPDTNNEVTKTVRLPFANVLTAHTLRDLFFLPGGDQ